MNQKHGTILKVRVDSTRESRLLTNIVSVIEKRGLFPNKQSFNKKYYIVTPNPEIILKAGQDLALRQILNRADFSLPDGVGLKLASLFFSGQDITIIHGRKVFIDLCKLSAARGWKVFLLGGEAGVAVKAAHNIKQIFPKLQIWSAQGPKLTENAVPVSEIDIKVLKSTIDKVNKISPDLLFVGLGCPKQEKFIAKYLAEMKVKLAMVVGGAFDYYAGKYPLPPRVLEKLELEWLWRLITQPQRVFRILGATLVFPLLLIKSKFEKSS